MSSGAKEREIRMEVLRPGQLNAERDLCPLVFVPVAPLEYHGPHLPVGMDPINATQSALESCRRLGKGVVHPTVYCGTERERPDWALASLGFDKDEWIVGMDFPAIWKSHYQQEHVSRGAESIHKRRLSPCLVLVRICSAKRKEDMWSRSWRPAISPGTGERMIPGSGEKS